MRAKCPTVEGHTGRRDYCRENGWKEQSAWPTKRDADTVAERLRRSGWDTLVVAVRFHAHTDYTVLFREAA